jgi:Glutaminyl-tRNA synthetase, non-specific RNA binding region part 1
MWVEADFENASGIGITVTEGEIKNVVAGYMSTNKDRILEDRYLALPLALKEMATNPFLKWADPKLRAEIMNKAFEYLLGPKDKQPVAPAKKKASPTSASSDRRTRWHRRKEGLQLTLPLKQLKGFSLVCLPLVGWEICISPARMCNSRLN